MAQPIKKILEALRTARTLPSIPDIDMICEKAKELLLAEPNVLSISSPVSIVGEVHGHFDELLEIFRVGGECPDTTYLFLGDYVNRGTMGVEAVFLLLGLKVLYPTRIFLLRGNHDCFAMTQAFGFYSEVFRKYGDFSVWYKVCDVFKCLPIMGIVDNELLCVHGGISRNARALDNYSVIDRFIEFPVKHEFIDVLWSDPDPDEKHTGFSESPRKMGALFTCEAMEKFLEYNKLGSMVRANTICPAGYQTIFKDKLTTVFSIPNFMHTYGNDGAIMEIGGKGTKKTLLCYTGIPQALLFDNQKDVAEEIIKARAQHQPFAQVGTRQRTAPVLIPAYYE